MARSRLGTGMITAVIGLGFLLQTVAWAGEAWLSVEADRSVSIAERPAVAAPRMVAQSQGVDGLGVTVQVAGLTVEPSETAGGRFLRVGWPDASVYGQIGAPAIPVLRRLFVAPLGAVVTVAAQEGAPVVVDLAAAGLPTHLMPVQPPIPKIPGALQNADFQFDQAAYALDAGGPIQRVVVTELGIVRGQRLCLLEIRPVAYNPAAGELTWWPRLSAEVSFAGGNFPEGGLTALPGLHRVVLNADLVSQARVRGSGNYLIVVANAYAADIASFATAKGAQGFNVTTYVDTSVNATTIKTYIESEYNGASPPDYVLLVGDTNTIPNWTGGGAGSPATDLPYSCMDGASDWYADIALGRFSVRSSGDVQAIVNKTLYYEDGPLSDPDYVKRAVFMASEDNYTVSEGTHNWVISNYMDPNNIVSDKLYCHTYNATTQQVRNAFNDGRFFGIYSGHGGTYSWADGPVFSQSDVNNLTNADMYPFVCSFACITGTYTVTECFTETWSRAANKGAAAIYGSSVNSYWTEDDILEKRLFDVIYDDGDNVPSEVGTVWNETRMRYLAQMGSGSTTRRYFEMYNLLGDPSLAFPGAVGLQVTPGNSLSSVGDPGGPFVPDSIVYTLENLGPGPISYDVTVTEPWLTVSGGTGTLPNVNDTAPVTITVNTIANGLPIGRHNATINFTNTTDGVGDTFRTVNLNIGIPDDCIAAVPVCPGTFNDSTAGMTNDGSASCGTSTTSSDMWYTYTPDTDGTATFSMCTGTAYDSVLSIHSGCPGTTGNQIVCDDDGCGSSNGPSSITLAVTADTEYLIRVSGFDGAVGNFTMTITGPDCVSPILDITFPNGVPEALVEGVPTNFDVQILPSGEVYVPGTGTLHYRYATGPYTTTPLTPLGGDLFQSTLPAANCNDTPEFYVSAQGDLGGTAYNPDDAPFEVFTAIVGSLSTAIDDDFNSDLGWTVENENVTGGAWERGVPVGGGDRQDPATCYGGTGVCYLTENLDGNSDVDGGPTRVVSPLLDLGVGNVTLEYAYWFQRDDEDGDDRIDVDVSVDGGTNWTTVASHNGPDDTWRTNSVLLNSFVSPSANARIRFSTLDNPNNSLLECGIDAVKITTVACSGAESCSDGILNQDEVRIDCGGVCPACTCTADGACDNGDFCDGAETCDAFGECAAGTAVDCDDGVACTDDSCNEGTDSCDNLANEADCDNGDFCDGAETCDAALDCQAGTAVDCDDSVGCTDDSCNEGTDSCDNVANDANCDNGDFCDGAETCDAALDCQAGSDPCPGQLCDEVNDVCVAPATIVSGRTCMMHDIDRYCFDQDGGLPDPRLGPAQLDLDLTGDVSSVSVSMSCASGHLGSPTVSIGSGLNGPASLLTVDFAPLPNIDCCTVTLSGDAVDQCDISTLVGDVNGSGAVNATDKNLVKGNIINAVDAEKYVFDVNANNVINATDKNLTKGCMGTSAILCP